MKRILFPVVILIALVIGSVVYTIAINNPAQPAETAKPPATPGTTSQELPEQAPLTTSPASPVAVTHSDNGFSPQTITISKGTTVNFTTSSAIPLWVASDPHPDHTDYPAFDSFAAEQKLPRPGDGFSFTFERAGTWRYHNHNSPAHVGVIVVK